MTTESDFNKVEIATIDFTGSRYATLLAETDSFGQPGTTLDYGVGLHPTLTPTGLRLSQRGAPELLQAIDRHATYVDATVSDEARKEVLLISLRGLSSRLRLLQGEDISPTQMAYDAYNIALPEEPYNDSWVLSFYEKEVLPLIPSRFFPNRIRTPEALLQAYDALKDVYRLKLLSFTSEPKKPQEERIKDLGKYTARLIFERAQYKGILTFDSVDAALSPLTIVPVIDSQGGEGGYFRFNADGQPEDTLNWQSKSEPTPWEILLTQAHELAGHYQEYTSKINMAWQRGWTEWAVAGLYSPVAYLSEGVAQLVPRYLYSDPESVLEASLKIYKQAEHHFDQGSAYRDEILNLIKIHQLIEYTGKLEFVRINATRRFEQALSIDDETEREREVQLAKQYFQTMCLRTEEQADRRVKFIRKYGGYTYVYPTSAQTYWDWFEHNGKTPEALLRLIQEPIIIGVNEEIRV